MTIAEQLRSRKHAMMVKELAELLNLNEDTIRGHSRRGHIPFFKVGATIRFDPQHVADWLEAITLIPISSRRYKKVG